LEINRFKLSSVGKAEVKGKRNPVKEIITTKNIPGIFFRGVNIRLINTSFFQSFKFTQKLLKPF
jgi:hypothetical protein